MIDSLPLEGKVPRNEADEVPSAFGRGDTTWSPDSRQAHSPAPINYRRRRFHNFSLFIKRSDKRKNLPKREVFNYFKYASNL